MRVTIKFDSVADTELPTLVIAMNAARVEGSTRGLGDMTNDPHMSVRQMGARHFDATIGPISLQYARLIAEQLHTLETP